MMKKRNVIPKILMLIMAGIFVVSCYMIYTYLREYEEGENVYTELEQYVSITKDAYTTSNKSEPSVHVDSAVEEQDSVAYSFPNVDFDSLKQMNPDIMGWITLEGTQINYPIAQSNDNSYYLNHLFDGTVNKSGCIFLDCSNSVDFSDRHSIIYGHHMKNGAMFGDLMNYKTQEFYDEHSVVFLMTPEQNYVIKVFAGYVANVKESAWKLDFTDKSFAVWLEEICAKSCFESDDIPKNTDRIVTLSTCTYEFEDARFVLHGILQPVN